jgi:hypothetical protein
MFNAQVHPLGASGGTSYANDLLKARATAILRPDLLDTWKTVEVSTTAGAIVGASANKDLSLTLSGVTESPDLDGLMKDGVLIAANDVVSISGIDRAFNGSYQIKGYTATASVVDGPKDTFKITVALTGGTAGNLTDGIGSILLSDTDKDGELKDAIIEGGGLYTFKLTSGLTSLFN